MTSVAPAHRCALVTGGGYGIGRATAGLLAEDGWRLLIVERDADRAQETCEQIARAGGVAEAVVGDVTQAETFVRAVAKAKTLGSLQGLVTCAALRHVGTITEVSEAGWRETIDVVLHGVFLACQHVIPEMIQAGGGSIVNVSSPDGFGRPNMVAYASAKAAVNALSTCLALDHRQHGIRVNVVLPGFVKTGMTEHYDAQRLARTQASTVAQRLGEPQDYARLIRLLMSSDGEVFTGGMFGSTLTAIP